MGSVPDENLPEVVADGSPQALTQREARLHQDQLGERDPKYPVVFDDAPKILSPPPPKGDGDTFLPPPEEKILWDPQAAETPAREDEVQPQPPAIICGLRRRVFWLFVALALTIVAAGVGGGVGGSMAAAVAKTQNGVEAGSSSSSGGGGSPTWPSTTTSAAAAATASIPAAPSAPSPSFLNNQTTPALGHAFQGFSGLNYSGDATGVIRDEGFLDIPFNCTSYVWMPNGTDCCVTFCVNTTTSEGWWCHEKRQPNASAPFQRIWTGCGVDAHKQHSCS